MTMENGGGKVSPRLEEDDDFGGLPPEQPPKAGVSKFSIPEGAGKMAVVSLCVTFLILALMNVAGGVGFVTQNDFAAKFADATMIVEQAKTELARTKSEINAAITNLPGTVSSQVTNSIAQSTIQWSTQLSSLTSNVQSNTTALNNVSAEVSKLESKINELEKQIGALETVAEEEEATPSEEDVYAELGSSYCFLTPENHAGTVFVELINDSNKDVEITALDLVVFPSQLGGTTYLASCTVSSGLIFTWSVVPLGSDMFLVQGRPMPYVGAPVLDADDSDDYPMVLSFTLKNGATLPESGLSLGMKINDFTYKVVE